MHLLLVLALERVEIISRIPESYIKSALMTTRRPRREREGRGGSFHLIGKFFFFVFHSLSGNSHTIFFLSFSKHRQAGRQWGGKGKIKMCKIISSLSERGREVFSQQNTIFHRREHKFFVDTSAHHASLLGEWMEKLKKLCIKWRRSRRWINCCRRRRKKNAENFHFSRLRKGERKFAWEIYKRKFQLGLDRSNTHSQEAERKSKQREKSSRSSLFRELSASCLPQLLLLLAAVYFGTQENFDKSRQHNCG